MSSKNNPEARGQKTEARLFGGKKVKPVLYIDGASRFIAAQYEDSGDLALDPSTKQPIPYGNV